MYAASQEYYRVNKQTLVAALYVRNSDPSKKDTEEQQAQVDALLAYAKKMGYGTEERLIYRDAISALKYPYWERPSLMKLWDDAERGEFDIVLCTEFFRLARKSSEQYAIMEYLKRFKVEVVSITEKFEDSAEGRLLHAVQGFLGEVEAEKIRIRTTRGRQHRATRALTGQGATPIYGYVFVDGAEYKKERYERNLSVIARVDGREITEVWVVKYCFASCLRGMSIRQIALALTRMGIPTQRGRDAWNPLTIRQILKREAYTGLGVNGLWTKDPETGRFTDKNIVKLPLGIYPAIIDHDTWEQVQHQLEINSEMSSRNTHHPQDYLMRSRMFCGICTRRMRLKHWNHPKPGHRTVKAPDYYCTINQGIDDALHHHSTSYPIHKADRGAWEFAVPYIQNPQLIREHVMAMKEQVVQRNHSADLEKDLATIKQGIANLYKLAEVADPNDTDGMTALQDRLVILERRKRDSERLLSGVTSVEEKQEKLLAAFDRFEAWAADIRPFLSNPTYVISQEDKISALLILGVKGMVWPTEGYPDRIKFTLMPPDIARFCDDDCTDGAGQNSSFLLPQNR
jgi:DNA invertase Pin-like site-specific DNA recombinase